jgi:hypothetical protein
VNKFIRLTAIMRTEHWEKDFSITDWMRASVAMSTEDVASSKMRMLGFFRSARARQKS